MRTEYLLALGAMALGVVACSDAAPALVLEIDAELKIPEEANQLLVILERGSVPTAESDEAPEEVARQVFGLGTPPRDRFPQRLPVVADGEVPEILTITCEAQYLPPDMSSVTVARAKEEFEFPGAGVREVRMMLERSCQDLDDDGFGIGFGCVRPDCDDTRPDIPRLTACPGAEEPIPRGRDGGVEPDAGADRPTPCSGAVCGDDERCFGGECRKTCQDNVDCVAEDVTLGCLPGAGVCICRVSCRPGDELACGPFTCVDGCCAL